MTLYEVITEVDNLRPNAIDDEMKARWVMQLEVEYAELMGVPVPELLFPEDQELLMTTPHDYSYVYYLSALVDNYNQDTALYNNDYAMANSAVDAAKSWYRRQNRPDFRGNWATRVTGVNTVRDQANPLEP